MTRPGGVADTVSGLGNIQPQFADDAPAGWFDIAQFDDLQATAVDPNGIQESIDYIRRLISMEVESGVPRHRIVVMGISQASCNTAPPRMKVAPN